ncbi:discoidin domain-containing protein [Yersinia enterocolitica]|uniref:discoidin domain-containing protein n=1 Tax=Yersinia enterocolitica TaxID=630 RepID=UPI000327E5C9|nr:discoidin domain-containing protein [Yersinia enterocolitica]CCV59709.1 putative exported protein [Yersinia enterocolitica (type O:2) str. YE3094/96]CNF09831.1 F5/8 type C domain-containing protein [Yersinia enterocolitica]
MKKQVLATVLLGSLFCASGYAAQIVAVTASGYDSEKGHVPANVADGDVKTRWAAFGESWVQLELDEQSIENILIVPFKPTERKLKFSIFYSNDGKNWQPLAEGLETSSADKNGEKLTFTPVTAKYIKLDTFGTDVNNWSAINEIAINSAAALPSRAIK